MRLALRSPQVDNALQRAAREMIESLESRLFLYSPHTIANPDAAASAFLKSSGYRVTLSSLFMTDFQTGLPSTSQTTAFDKAVLTKSLAALNDSTNKLYFFKP